MPRLSSLLVASGVLLASAVLVPAGVARADIDTSAKAAQAIVDARDRANRAATELATAEEASAQLTDQISAVQAEVDATAARLTELSKGVEQLALSRFVSGGSSGLSLLAGVGGPTEQVEADVLADAANDVALGSIDDYEATRRRLIQQQSDLAGKQAALDQTAKTLETMRRRAEDEVKVLGELERTLLRDEENRRALAARQAEERRKAEERAETAAATQAASQDTSRSPNAPSDAAPGASPAAPAGGDRGPATKDPPAGQSPKPDPGGGATAPPAGSKGGGGCGDSCGYVDTSIVCPVAGTSAFANTFGAARSGGRSHQGVDMLAARGTPIVAVVSGSANPKQTPLGGNSVWLEGNNGNRYYYAHLDAFESSGAVSPGDVIGYVGDTGNAKGTPHLHFEIHPGGGAAVNPTPSVRAAC